MHAYEMIIPKRTRGDFVMKTTLMSLQSRGFVYLPFRSGGLVVLISHISKVGDLG